MFLLLQHQLDSALVYYQKALDVLKALGYMIID